MRCSITVDYFDRFMPDGSAIDASCYISTDAALRYLAVLPDDETKTVTFTCEEKPSGV